jgi:hypothetical protein
VLNSGFTYRQYDYLNNARQVPKLPDWAVIDTSQPPNARTPGKIVNADFFDERWQLKPARKAPAAPKPRPPPSPPASPPPPPPPEPARPRRGLTAGTPRNTNEIQCPC